MQRKLDDMSSSTTPQGIIYINKPQPHETRAAWREPPEPANPVVKGLPLYYGAILYV